MRGILTDQDAGIGEVASGAPVCFAGTMAPAMATPVTDRDSFLKALAPLRDALFVGTDLVHDAAAGTMSLTVTCEDRASGGGRGFLRRAGWKKHRRVVIHVRHIVSYKQYLTTGPSDIYVLDRAEVGRGGQELAFYFRPGDRAVMDVGQIDVRVEDAGHATSLPRRPDIINPVIAREKARRG